MQSMKQPRCQGRSRADFERAHWLWGVLIVLLLLPGVSSGQSNGNNGNGAGGGTSANLCASCEPPPLPALDARFIAQSVPAAMAAGQTYAVSVQMQNTGTDTWLAGSTYKLGSQNPVSGMTWALNRVVLATSTASGQTATFNFSARAPNSAGTYNFQWRMIEDSVSWFGNASSNVAVVVTGSVANSPPGVQLTAPAVGGSAAAPAYVTLSANATDVDGTVAQVEFWSNGLRVATDTTAPYSVVLNALAAGIYQFKAVAIDNLALAATSAQVAYTITSSPVVTATRSYVYDANERLCKTINPESGASLVDYDAAGNILWTADGTTLTSMTCDRASVAESQKSVRYYDALNRLTGISTPGRVADVSTSYYADGLTATLTASNPGGAYVVTSYNYNKRRLLISEALANDATRFTLGYGYDANGFLSATSYPDGQVITSSPDALGRATRIASAATGGPVYASNISYHPGGAISGFTYGNGLLHTMVQNTRRLPARSWDRNAAGTTVVLNDDYVFDENGNVDYISDATAATANNRSRDLGYDGRDRLIVADAPYQWGKATYAYDALDNLRVADQGSRKYRYNYDPVSQRLSNIKDPAGVNQFVFGYDASGNVTAKGAQAYAFDSANRLTQVVGKQTYRYDGQGRRVQATDADGKTTFWIYSQSGQVLYTSEARRSQNLSYIYLGNTQVATRAVAWGTGAATVSYQHTDSLGSPVVETSAAGAIVKRNSYAPYGEAYNSSIDGTGYTGHVMDQGTGLTYMQQRFYDPQLGRFLSVDAAAPRESGDNFNRYSYASDSPYRFTDPDGRESSCFASGNPSCGVSGGNFRENMGSIADGLEAFDSFATSLGPYGGLEHIAAVPLIALFRAGATEVRVGAAMARGRASETRILKEMGLAKNTEKVLTAEGKAIPDAMTSTLSVEIKDTAKVSLTKQLRIQTAAAKAAGKTSVLVTGKNTHISANAKKAFAEIIRRDDLGQKK